jgi:hypothetical protein
MSVQVVIPKTIIADQKGECSESAARPRLFRGFAINESFAAAIYLSKQAGCMETFPFSPEIALHRVNCSLASRHYMMT